MTNAEIKIELNRLFKNVLEADIYLRHFEAIYHYVDFIKRTPILWEIVDGKEGSSYEAASKIIMSDQLTKEERNLKHSLSRVTNVWHIFGFMHTVYRDWKETQESGEYANHCMQMLQKYARGDLYNQVRLKWRVGGDEINEEQEYRSMHNKILNHLLLVKDEQGAVVEKVSPKDIKVEFLLDKSALIVNQQTVDLPPYKDEYCLCKVIFSRPANQPIDWEIVYEEMTGNPTPNDYAKAKKKVSDASRRVNARVLSSTGVGDLLVWQVKTIKRKY